MSAPCSVRRTVLVITALLTAHGVFADDDVRILRQASTGHLLWTDGTALHRSDGRRTEVVLDSLTDVTALEVTDGHVVVGLASGEVRTRTPDGRWTMTRVDGVPTTARMDTGRLLVGTRAHGLFSGPVHADWLSPMPPLPDPFVHDVVVRPDRLLCATDRGLFALASDGQEWTPIRGLSDPLVIDLVTDADSGLLVLTSSGVVHVLAPGTDRVDAGDRLFTSGIRDATHRNGLTVVVEADGTCRMASTSGRWVTAPDLPATRDIMLDDEGTLWWADGTGRLAQRPVWMDWTPWDMPLHAILVRPDGTRWTSEEGTVRIERPDGSVREHLLPPAFPVVSFAEAPDGTVLAGSMGGGLLRFAPTGEALPTIDQSDGLINDHILHLEVADTTLWMATLDGVAALDLRTMNWVNLGGRFNDPTTSYIFSVLPWGRDSLFVASDGRGVLRMTAASTTSLDLTEADEESVLVLERTGRHLLAAVQGQGIVEIRPSGEVVDRWPSARGEVIGLLDLEVGTVVATTAGVELRATNHEPVRRVDLGGPHDANLQHLRRDAHGRVHVAYYDGVLTVREDVLSFRARPRVDWHTPRVWDRPVDATEDVVLPARDDRIAFRFPAVWLSDPDAVRYRYRLVGRDDRWTETTAPQAVFGDLSPGNYTFEMTCQAGEGPQTTVQTFAFRIARPWWRRPAIIPFEVLAIVGLLALGIRRRDRVLREREALARRRLALRYENLKKQVNPHFMFNSLNSLAQLIEEDPDRAVRYLDDLSVLLRRSMTLDMGTPISLRDELDLCDRYVRMQGLRFEDNLRVTISIDDAWLDALVFPFAVQGLIENTIKHNVVSSRSPLELIVTTRDDLLIVRNRVHRRMGSAEAGSGMGLTSLVERYGSWTDRPVEVIEDDVYFEVRIPLQR